MDSIAINLSASSLNLNTDTVIPVEADPVCWRIQYYPVKFHVLIQIPWISIFRIFKGFVILLKYHIIVYSLSSNIFDVAFCCTEMDEFNYCKAFGAPSLHQHNHELVDHLETK